MKRGFALLGAVWLAGCAHFQPEPLSPTQTAAEFDAHSLTDAGLERFLESNKLAGPWPRPAWDLEALTLAAFYYHPDLPVARAGWAVARAGQITAGERPNPTVSVGPGYDSQIPDNPSPWLVPLTIDVPIETAGKRARRLEQARHLAEAARWRVVGAAWQIRSRVRTSLLTLFAASQTQALLSRQEAGQSNVVHLLEGQLAAGGVSGYEVTQARVALNTTRLAAQDAWRQSLQARAQLADALGLSLAALEGVHLSFAGLDAFPRPVRAGEIRRQALLNRADVRGALADYAASQSALQLEIARQYPDVHLGPGYAWNAGSAGDNQWDLGLSVTLPVFNQNQGPIAEAKALRRQAAATFRAVQAKAMGELDAAYVNYQAARQESATAGGLLQNLARRLQSVREMEQAGEVDPLTVANAQVEYNAGALAQLDAMVKAQEAMGRLEDAVQSPLVLSAVVIENVEQPARPAQFSSEHAR
ncbi:MAG: TolC family protein [Verrucomicrobia bacterium]|nr:TolC family protein [Verrucomicrobiota bacterium]